MANLSPHISEAEYRCGGINNTCCGKLPPGLYDHGDLVYCYDYLFDVFEAARQKWGRAIPIISGYRCKKHNAEVDGEPLSAHLFGLALDLAVTGDDVPKFVEMVKSLGMDVRIGWKMYNGRFVHIDCGHFIWPRPSEFLVPGVEW